VRACGCCRRQIEDDFRFCPSCGTPQRLKIVEYFTGDERLDDGGLRVSAYLTSPQHVRMSIWRGAAAQAAISLRPDEARRLAAFLNSIDDSGDSLADSLRRTAAAVKRSFAGA
jgi:hypothetical protein